MFLIRRLIGIITISIISCIHSAPSDPTRIMYIVLLVTIGLHGLQGDKPVLCISIIIPGDISKYQISNMVGGLTTKAAPFVKKAEKELEASTIKLKFAEWDFASNINENNENVKLAAEKQLSQLKRRLGTEAQQFDLTKLKDKDVRRKVELLRLMGTSALPDEKLDRFNRIVSDMRRTFNQAKVKKKDGGELLDLEELQKVDLFLTKVILPSIDNGH